MGVIHGGFLGNNWHLDQIQNGSKSYKKVDLSGSYQSVGISLAFVNAYCRSFHHGLIYRLNFFVEETLWKICGATHASGLSGRQEND